ncbi:MAG TPA: HD domain-containing protein [Caulobacteraceae bacterium]|nr:HD domain-containing protein [Caulobacteraceae bacterium]
MADGETMIRAKFHAMTEGTQGDWDAIRGAGLAYFRGFPDRLIAHLKLLEGDSGGFAVDRMTHSLQTATRAFRAGRDEEYVACALVHDVGDILGPTHHAEIGAEIMKPFVSAENHWIMQHHAIFQGYYYFHYLGGDRDRREAFRGHPSFEACAQFCHLYDQSSFDPAYDTMPLDAFEPMLRRVCAAPKQPPAAFKAS